MVHIFLWTQITIHGGLSLMDFVINMITVLSCNFQNTNDYVHDHSMAHTLRNFQQHNFTTIFVKIEEFIQKPKGETHVDSMTTSLAKFIFLIN